MRRGALTKFIVYTVFGTVLVAWLVWSTRPEAQVHALENQTSKSVEPITNVLARGDAENTSIVTQPEPVANESEPAEIVPAGPRGGPRQTPIDNVAGPELAPGLTPGAVLQNVRSVVRDYSARFGGNPIGNNREITAKLNGGNPKQVVFLKEEDGMRINGRGELIDNWGTPFFFHQISASEMEIRSAGPDGKMWTADDLVLK